MDLYAATQAFNAAANNAWTTCNIVDIPGCPGWTFNGPARPTTGFFAAISYDGREIAPRRRATKPIRCRSTSTRRRERSSRLTTSSGSSG